VEPVIGSGSNPPPLVIVDANLQNCVPANPATPNCSTSSGIPMYLATYDPTNANPYWQFDCHNQTYQALSNGTAGSGTSVGITPWPEDYQPTTPGSINDPTVRATNIYLKPDGTLGTAVAPMYNWSSSSPC